MTTAWGHQVPARAQRFLERESELERIAAALHGAAGGGSWPVLIVGGAGLGKSSLLGASRGRCVALGIEPLWARAEELESTLPWSLARQLLAPALASLPARDRDVVLSGAAARARALLDDDAEAAPASVALLPLVHSLFWVIAGLAERKPLALFVDDAHLADEPSMLLLAYLGRRLAELPVTLVLAHRPVVPGSAVAPLDELTAHPRSEPVNLVPLSAGAVAALTRDALGAGVDGDLTEACLEVTGGNPFYLQELLRALLAVPEQTPTAAAVRALVPTAVARSLFLRLTRLPADAGRLARAAAVLGERATLPRAAELAGIDPERTAALADQLAEAEILRPAEPLRFIHPLVGAAIHDDLPPSQRSDWHRRAAAVLERSGAEPTVLAAHLLSTGARSDQWVVDRLRSAAAAAAAQGGFAAAAQYLVRALDEPPRADQRADVLIELGRIESALGHPSAPGRLRSALELTGEPEQRARLRFELGRALLVGGEHAEAARTFEQGLTDVTDPESELARELRAAWWMAASADPVERARVMTAGAPEVGAGEVPTLGQRQLTAQLAQEQAFAGQRRERLKTLAERAWGDGALLEGETSDGLTWPLVTGALLAADELELELKICDAVLADARRRGSPMAYASASYCRAWPLLRRGQVSDAIADAQAAVGAHDDGWATFLPMAAAVLALAQLERGDLAAVRAALSLAEAVTDLARTNQFPMVLIARGRLMVVERDFAAAAATIQRAGELIQAIGFDSPTLFPWRTEAARAASLAGQATTAMELADAALAAAERSGVPLAIADAIRAQAATAGADAIELLQRALGLLPQVPRLERIHALVMLGASLRRANHRRQATDALQQALALAAAGGVRGLAETARTELAAMGVRVKRNDTGEGAASLTPAEERVARLAADGHSNREIAQMLFVTVKTVEFHLGNAYRKLGVNSRSQLTRALANGSANPA